VFVSPPISLILHLRVFTSATPNKDINTRFGTTVLWKLTSAQRTGLVRLLHLPFQELATSTQALPALPFPSSTAISMLARTLSFRNFIQKVPTLLVRSLIECFDIETELYCKFTICNSPIRRQLALMVTAGLDSLIFISWTNSRGTRQQPSNDDRVRRLKEWQGTNTSGTILTVITLVHQLRIFKLAGFQIPSAHLLSTSHGPQACRKDPKIC